MSIKLRLAIYIPAFFLFGCTISKNDSDKINQSNRIDLKMTVDISKLLQIDSIFSNVKAIPLETNYKCLFTEVVKAAFYSDRIFLQDRSGKLFVFSPEGIFINEIGKQGRGPGEVLELRDFDLDKDGNIYILDYQKIHKYSFEGEFLNTIPLQFLWTTKLYSNPFQFVLKNDSLFYLWGGSFDIEENRKGKSFAMFETTKSGPIKAKYFPVTYTFASNSNQFKRFNDQILLDPIFGNYVIYSIDNNNGVSERYKIDFGDNVSSVSLPKEFTTSRAFKDEIYNRYFHSIGNVTETVDWLYFMFQSKMKILNAFYSKKLHKSFVSTGWPLPSGRIAPIFFLGNHANDLIGFMNTKEVIEIVNKCKTLDYSNLPSTEKQIIKRLANIKETDNPIMFVCTFKVYQTNIEP